MHTTQQYEDKGKYISYKLKVKNYNDLCMPSTIPIILGLLILPEDENFRQNKKLESVPDLSKRTSGKITVVYPDDNDFRRTVTASLNKEDYDKAIEAHSHGNHIEIVGDIRNPGKRNASIFL